MLTAVVLEELLQRVSRQARELSIATLLVTLVKILTAVEVNIMSI